MTSERRRRFTRRLWAHSEISRMPRDRNGVQSKQIWRGSVARVKARYVERIPRAQMRRPSIWYRASAGGFSPISAFPRRARARLGVTRQAGRGTLHPGRLEGSGSNREAGCRCRFRFPAVSAQPGPVGILRVHFRKSEGWRIPIAKGSRTSEESVGDRHGRLRGKRQ